MAIFPQAVTERYAYDGASQLIGEYGTTDRDYVWLGGILVALIDNIINGSVTTSVVNYVTADQLGTPRVVSDGAGTVIWSWNYQGNPFGEQQPTSATGYVLNLRYPGQYYDAETGTNYNLFRTYESATGRYLQPDPMGQAVGPSLYAYVGNSPLSYVDTLGLFPELPERDAKEERTAEEAAALKELRDRQQIDREVAEANATESPAIRHYPSPSEFGLNGMCSRPGTEMSTVGPIPSNGASTDGLLTSEIIRIQNAADRAGVDINLVESRAANTAHPSSDWDYVINANAKTRNSLSRSLPGAGNLNEGIRPNIDVFSGAVNPGSPSIKFTPRQ